MLDQADRDRWASPPPGAMPEYTRGQHVMAWTAISVISVIAVAVVGFFTYAAWTEYPLWWVRGGLVLAAVGGIFYLACGEMHRRQQHRETHFWCITCLQDYTPARNHH